MRTIVLPLLAALLNSVSVQAQDAAPPQQAEPSHFAIVGLAPNDLLNIRARASATGMMIARLPVGSVVKNLGCSDVEGVRWCKVSDVRNDTLQGWAAERYLSPVDMESEPVDEAPSATDGPDDAETDGTSILPAE